MLIFFELLNTFQPVCVFPGKSRKPHCHRIVNGERELSFASDDIVIVVVADGIVIITVVKNDYDDVVVVGDVSVIYLLFLF